MNSPFSYVHGITVSHSTDLVNWKLIGYVLERPEQLSLDGREVSRGIFAQAIRYHHGIYYVTCTLVDIGENFVATSKSPGSFVGRMYALDATSPGKPGASVSYVDRFKYQGNDEVYNKSIMKNYFKRF